RRVHLWRVRAPGGTKPTTLSGHKGVIEAIVFLPRSRILASTGLDMRVRLWNATTGRPIAELRDRTAHRFGSLAASPDGKLLAAGDETGIVFIWDAATWRLRTRLRCPAAPGGL